MTLTKEMVKIEKKEGTTETYLIVLEGEEQPRDVLAEVHSTMDTLMFTYFIEKALTEDIFGTDEFKNYIIESSAKFPFLTIPTE